jgi:YD repeat-containing protein
MLQGRDDKVGDKPDQIVSALSYDGYGNRVAETRAGATTSYTYDAANRLATSSAGEQWHYDAVGNTVDQTVSDGEGHLLRTQTTLNAENRAARTDSTDKDGKHTISKNTFDAVGNIVNTRIDGDGYGFDEVTKRDVRYLERSKKVANSFAKGAKGLAGETKFTYDANGNLALLDRGKKTGAREASIAVFDYDLQGQIISRADKATALTGADFFQGFETDPTAQGGYDADGYAYTSLFDQISASVIGNGSGATLQSYLYAGNKPVSEARGTLAVQVRTLSLIDGTASTDADGNATGWSLTLSADDIVNGSNGQVDRAATARRIAERHYAGFTALSASAQAKVAAYVESQLPANVAAGASIGLHGWIVMSDATLGGITQITDYSVKQIGADGMPSG